MTIAFGIVGLGRIGGGLALQALGHGMQVVGHDPRAVDDTLLAAGLQRIDRLAQFCELLQTPRRIFLYVPAGAIVDQVLEELAPRLDRGDVVVDGGNSYWGDSIRRQRKCRDDYGFHFVDVGTSGGARGARNGACFMAGGTPEGYALVEPILARLAVPDGLVHCGSPGSGHFTKLVHNGIEFGMLQAIGEGMALLEHHRDVLPVPDILRTWNHGSVIRSWLVELMEEEYRAHRGTDPVPPYIEDTGEVDWLVDDAMHMEVPIPVITLSVMQLLASREKRGVWARAIAMMRHGFGEHPYGPNERVASYRRTSRIGPWLKYDDPDR